MAQQDVNIVNQITILDAWKIWGSSASVYKMFVFFQIDNHPFQQKIEPGFFLPPYMALTQPLELFSPDQ